METMTLKIGIPEGYEIDKEKSTFEILVLKKIEKKFSKNWEEFCKNNNPDNSEVYIDDCSVINPMARLDRRRLAVDKNLFPKKFADPMLALMQLLTIREKEYTKGWEPNWSGIAPVNKYGICVVNGALQKVNATNTRGVLFFPNEKLRDEFFKNWKDLLEIAKPLL